MAQWLYTHKKLLALGYLFWIGWIIFDGIRQSQTKELADVVKGCIIYAAAATVFLGVVWYAGRRSD